MAKDSGIQWTKHTFNPWWGCEKVSAACKHCYAESFAKRVGKSVWGGADSPRRLFGETHWKEPLKWNRDALKAGERHRVFCASMADVFEDRRDLDAERAKLWPLIAATPALDWLLLSKRWGSADIVSMVPREWADGWPANVWAGATVEDQEQANKRIPALLRVPTKVRFLSMEPLLGPVDLRRVTWPDKGGHRVDVLRFGYWESEKNSDGFVNHSDMYQMFGRPIQWIILGGESGPKARELELGWVRSIMEQAAHTDTKVFVKQFGENAIDPENGIAYHRRTIEAERDGMVKVRRLRLADSHGGDPNEWPADLRVREFPRA